MSAAKILWGQIAIVIAIVLIAVWAATQWTAWRLGFQPQLGRPWFELGVPVYLPPAFFWWWYAYDAYAPRIFLEGAFIAASGGFISIAVAIGMSVWRGRETQNVATYGSARWATRREVRAAGLSGPDGVVLGRFGRDYLRHDGPEHVLCFAPTRSGKGVGLVLPTLLTWPASAIVHDIKGENWEITAGLRAGIGRVLLFDPTNARIPPLTTRCWRSAAAYRSPRRPEHCRYPGRSRGCAGAAEPLGKDQPLPPGRRHPSCPLCGARQDTRRGRKLSFRSAAADQRDIERHDDDGPPGLGRAPPGRRIGRPRALEQERQRTFRGALDGDVVPGALSRSRRRAGNKPLRLAHPRPRRWKPTGNALSGCAAVRHQPNQAAGSADPQPDRPAPHGRPACQEQAPSAAAHAR